MSHTLKFVQRPALRRRTENLCLTPSPPQSVNISGLKSVKKRLQSEFFLSYVKSVVSNTVRLLKQTQFYATDYNNDNNNKKGGGERERDFRISNLARFCLFSSESAASVAVKGLIGVYFKIELRKQVSLKM